jgi:two-component system OmpR family response regulator
MRGSAGICGDDEVLCKVMQRALEQADFTVRATATGAAALAAFSDDPPDILILDIGLPDADGRDVCRALRARGVDAPVLFLAAGDATAERIAATDAGGDDYLAKPFPLAALLVRIGGLTRPRAGKPPRHSDIAPHLSRSARAIVAGDARISLTPIEFRLLLLLTDRRGQVVTRAELVAAGWPNRAAVSENALDTYLARLRRKLRNAGAVHAIRTRRGMGYELR